MDKVQLDDLPESSNKEFWGDADTHTGITPQVLFDQGGHIFRRVSGHEAYCDHCGWGFALDPGDKVKEGHVYTKDGTLVI